MIREIIKNYQNHGKEYKYCFYYYRDTEQKEIDLLYVNRGVLTPIESKKGIAISKPSKNFSALAKYRMPVNKGIIIDCCDRMRPTGEEAYTLPIAYIG